jgi:hypothetical protein
MTTNRDYLIAGGIAAIGFASPVIPTMLLLLLDNIVVRVLVVAALLYSITQGPLIGLATLVTIGLLFIERNRHKVVRARNKFERIMEASDNGTQPQMTVEQEGVPQNTVKVREFDEADGRDAVFLPGKNTGNDEFNRVPWSEELNDKRALKTVPIGNKSAYLFKDFMA